MSGAWDFATEPDGRARLFGELCERGVSLLRPPAPFDAARAALVPWEAAESVLGAIDLVERQPIAPVAWGRSFASTMAETPLHSDSQSWHGVPPHLQLMFCEKRAERGGETLLLDSWDLLDRIERVDRVLFADLFELARTICFVFGDVIGPTVSLRGGSLVFTHAPRAAADDTIAARLLPHLNATPRSIVRVDDGELLVVDNHRMLHGRAAFGDERRKFTRLLAWLPAPLARPARHAARARDMTPTQSLPSESARRRRAVIDLLRGVPPGVLSTRLAVPEPVLYAWRDAALGAVDRTLGTVTDSRSGSEKSPAGTRPRFRA